MFPSLIHHDPLCLFRFIEKAKKLDRPWNQILGFETLLFSRDPLLAPHLLQILAKKQIHLHLDRYLFQKYPRYLLPRQLSFSLFENDLGDLDLPPEKELCILLSTHRSIPRPLLEKHKAERAWIFYDSSYHTGVCGDMGTGHLQDHPFADLMIGAFGGIKSPPIGWIAGSPSFLRFFHAHSSLLFTEDQLHEEEKKALSLFFWLTPSMHHEKSLLRAAQKKWILALRDKGIMAHDAGCHRFSIRLPYYKALEFQRRLCKEEISFFTHKIDTALEQHCCFEGALSLDHRDEHLDKMQELIFG